MIDFFVSLWNSHTIIELYLISFICNLIVLMPVGYILFRINIQGKFSELYSFNPKPTIYWSLLPLSVVGLPIFLLIDYIIYEIKNT